MRDSILFLATLLFYTTPVAAWFTHLISCLLTAKYILLAIGVIVFPIGIIHGIGIWLGINW